MHLVRLFKPVAKYARISDDQEEEGKGVARQIKDCTTLLGLRDWLGDDEHTYIDNDVSAYKRGVVRPEWERMMRDLEEGRIGGIVVYDLDRFARQPKDLERAIEIYATRPNLVFATVQGDINLMTPDGITMARVMVAFANKASMDTARRMARKHLEQAQNGIPVGGWRPAGWLDDKRTLDPFESELIKGAATQILAGVPLATIMREWNDAGFLTPAGNHWSRAPFRNLMMSARLAGWRDLKGEPVYDDNGDRVRGKWTSILSDETHIALVAKLKAEGRGGGYHERPGKKKYLLAGIIQCGVCFSPMRGHPGGKKLPGRHYYQCPSPVNSAKSCGGPSASGIEVDRLITELFHAQGAQQRAEPVDNTARMAALTAELEDVMSQIRQLGADFGARKIPAEFVNAALGPLNESRATITHELDTLKAAKMQGDLVQHLGGKPWDELEMDEKRALIASQFPSVLIMPRTTNIGPKFDPERVVPSRTRVVRSGEWTPATAAPAASSEPEPTPAAEPLTTEP
jgi:DNA invertase Pin-like site-specific DNA recombinase